MAYFYQHIKGLASNGYNWKISIDDALTLGPVGYSYMYTPTFSWSYGNTSHNEGYFITSLAEYGRIKHDFYFLNKVYFNTESTPVGTIGNYHGYIGHDNNGLEIKGGGSSEGNSSVLNINATQIKFQGAGDGNTGTRIQFISPSRLYNNTNAYDNPIWFGLKGKTNNVDVYKGFSVACFVDTSGSYSSSSSIEQTKILTDCPLYVHDYIRVRKNSSNANGYIDVDNYVQALYFNATSDKRAKTNITRSTFSALGLIKALPIYNFKYKSDGSDSIGIIAQEALNVSAGDFGLVCNPQASGENGNYMSVKESKLVYIAWKAIQEQQEIIDKQQEQINQLTELVNKLIQK